MGKHAGKIAVLSTGDPVKDAAEVASAELHCDRMDKNICPNGCGYMIIDTPNTRHCPVCKFQGWQNTPIEVS